MGGREPKNAGVTVVYHFLWYLKVFFISTFNIGACILQDKNLPPLAKTSLCAKGTTSDFTQLEPLMQKHKNE